MTGAEKTQGALATGNATFPTVKQVADRADRLLVDFTVPIDTASIAFGRDKNGELFSNLNIQDIIISWIIQTNSGSFNTGILTVNELTNRYNSNLALTTGFPINFNNYSNVDIFIRIINSNITYAPLAYFTATSINPISGGLLQSYRGFNTSTVSSITCFTINAPTSKLIKSGSTIKIYRND